MKVEIKVRLLTAGNRSLYLEYYETGFRKRENLHLYLVPDDAPNARKLNEQTYRKAQEIQAQRILTPPSFEKKEKREENEAAKTMTWLQWCGDYVRCAMLDGNCKKMIQHKDIVRRRIEAYLKRAKRTDVLAFGFSCMTGLRLGDMQRLRWSDIKDVNGVQTVSVIQHKTKRPVAVPLNALALSLLPPKPENGEDGIIFPLVKKPDNVAKYVRRIKDKAGIEKDFTYHSSRHSAATLAITAGAELYSVSKILGHGSIASTQVYAKVKMEKKVEAMNLTNGVF